MLAQSRREADERDRHHDRGDGEREGRITAAPAAAPHARDSCEIDVGSDGGTPLGYLVAAILPEGSGNTRVHSLAVRRTRNSTRVHALAAAWATSGRRSVRRAEVPGGTGSAPSSAL